MEDEILTQEEVSAILGVTLKALKQLRVARNGPTYLKLSPGQSGRVRYWRSAVERHQEVIRQETLLLITREETAAALGITIQLLDRRRGDPEFPKCIEIGIGRHARIRYRREDVERYAEARKAL
jgi:predicted DNA-binding transcriptional regulator AlpA